MVAIRDGKVSSETVRQASAEGEGELAGHHAAFTELIVLDSAGRLQIPKEFREKLGIQRYVRMEMVEDGIFIRRSEAQAGLHPAADFDTKALDGEPQGSRLSDLLKRWLPKRGSRP